MSQARVAGSSVDSGNQASEAGSGPSAVRVGLLQRRRRCLFDGVGSDRPTARRGGHRASALTAEDRSVREHRSAVFASDHGCLCPHSAVHDARPASGHRSHRRSADAAWRRRFPLRPAAESTPGRPAQRPEGDGGAEPLAPGPTGAEGPIASSVAAHIRSAAWSGPRRSDRTPRGRPAPRVRCRRHPGHRRRPRAGWPSAGDVVPAVEQRVAVLVPRADDASAGVVAHAAAATTESLEQQDHGERQEHERDEPEGPERSTAVRRAGSAARAAGLVGRVAVALRRRLLVLVLLLGRGRRHDRLRSGHRLRGLLLLVAGSRGRLGFGLSITQPHCAVSTSMRAVTSEPRNVVVPARRSRPVPTADSAGVTARR